MVAEGVQQGEAGLRVLVVEDETLIAMLLEDMLAELGHEVVATASDLAGAQEAAQREGLDIAILDLHLADGQSHPVAEILSTRGIPYAYATGYGDMGADRLDGPVLHKPFRLADLASIVAQLQARRAGKAAF